MTYKTLFSRVLITTLTMCTLSFNSYAQQERIISAGSNITELFFALGAEDALVAVDLTSRHYAEKADLPQVGYHRQLSAEGLMSLNPTRLIGSEDMGPESTVSLLKASQVDVVIMPAGNSISVLNERIDIIAEITGHQQKAAQLKEEVKQSVAQLESAQEKMTEASKPKVLYLMLSKDRPANVAGKNTSIDEIIKLSGAKNPASELIESYKPLSYEAIINMQPEYILVSERALESFGSIEKIIKDLPLLAATPAGKNGQIIAVPGTALIGGFGLQSLELAQKLQQQFKTNTP